jgi:hypothetical protein
MTVAHGKISIPEYKVSGRGTVHKNALGRYAGRICRFLRVSPRDKEATKKKILQLVYQYLVLRNQITEDYVYAILEVCHADRGKGAVYQRIYQWTCELATFFEDMIKKDPDLTIEEINRSCPDDFMQN